jgi:hypothetical protein
MAGLIPVQQCFLFLKTILVFSFLVEPFTVSQCVTYPVSRNETFI